MAQSKPKLMVMFAALSIAILCGSARCVAQDTPLLSGGVGFFTSTNGGNTTYLPIIEPLLAAPIGNHFLVESRAALQESFFPNTNGQSGYSHEHFVGLTYLQGDFIASPHVTVVGGSYLLPFGSYNERLSPIWISNFFNGPPSSNIGLLTGIGVGGMLRGSAISRRKYSVDYTTWFSASSTNEQFNANRSVGLRTDLYMPENRLEIGFSFNRLLQGTNESFYGVHVWWEPKNTAFRLRSEFDSGAHANGYWIEADYRTQHFGGLNSWIGRFEPVFRMNQTFRLDNVAGDNVPLVNTQRPDFGLDYNLPHNVRILTSYSRQFSSTGNVNIWQTGIVYRFLFPAWKGKL